MGEQTGGMLGAQWAFGHGTGHPDCGHQARTGRVCRDFWGGPSWVCPDGLDKTRSLEEATHRPLCCAGQS